MAGNAFIFECSSTTYLDCVEKNLFGSNKPWPMQIKAGDYCLLHHYEIGGLRPVPESWPFATDACFAEKIHIA
jgi:hypothetical protein